MQRCGFCQMVSGVLRRAMCVGSRRGSSESYYRELENQDTLKIEDKSSDFSDDAQEETSLCRRCRETPRVSPQSSPRGTPRTSRQASPQTSPRTSPRPTRRASPRTSPRPSRHVSLKTSPSTSPPPSRRASLQKSPRPSRRASEMSSPSASGQGSSQRSPRPSRQTRLKTSHRTSRQTSPSTSRQASPSTSRQASQKISPKSKWHASPRVSPEPSRLSRTHPQISPQKSRRTSPSSQHSSTDSSAQSSARSSPQSSRGTTPKTSPWSSRRSSLQSSPSASSRFSSRRLSWLRYTRGSHLYYLHSEVQTDSMEEKDPAHYEMKMKVSAGGRFLTMHKRRKKRLITRSLYSNQALLDDLMMGQVQCILDQSVQWKFNAFTLETVSGGRCLPVLCVHLFQTYGLLAHFQLDVTKAWKLFSLIEEGYHSTNPYHNSIHAADVTQAMHCFLQQKRIREHLTPLEILASLLAAIAHDLDHPGVNQPFLIATSNHLAALYENTSVLENHHWRSAMSCLVESGILDHLPPIPGLREKLENQISSLILATDITRQQEYLTHFKNHLENGTLDMTKSEHRHLVLQIALKCADISNPCRPWEISRKWSLKVCEEFFRQGDYERRLHLPVTALCDRHTTSIPKIQTGFFKFVVTPLISEWHTFLQNDLSTQMLKNLKYNQQRWETLMNEETNEETRTETSDADNLDDEDDSRKSGSQSLLLPPRRGSLNPPPKKMLFREQLRRFSVPLNVFQDARFRYRERSRAASLADARAQALASAGSSQPSLHSQLSVRGHCSHSQEPERPLNSEVLMPDSTIASITTPAQAVRLNTVLKESNMNKLVRQQTFPPSETASTSRCTNDDLLSRFRPDFLRPSTSKKACSFLVVTGLKKSDLEDTSDINLVTEPPALPKEKENPVAKSSRRDTSTVGSQLRDNLSRMPLELELESDPLLQRRRKSMPATVLPLPPREKKIREAPAVVPQFQRRTFSKESWSRRRGSAPSPVAASELRGLASLGSLRHSVNGGRRKPSLTVTCQQWLAKATSAQERTLQFPRRSSLPVEVMTGISTH